MIRYIAKQQRICTVSIIIKSYNKSLNICKNYIKKDLVNRARKWRLSDLYRFRRVKSHQRYQLCPTTRLTPHTGNFCIRCINPSVDGYWRLKRQIRRVNYALVESLPYLYVIFCNFSVLITSIVHVNLDSVRV